MLSLRDESQNANQLIPETRKKRLVTRSEKNITYYCLESGVTHEGVACLFMINQATFINYDMKRSGHIFHNVVRKLG